MRQVQVCSHGHRWDPTTDRRPDHEARWNVCPVCGGAVEMFSLRDTSTNGNGSVVQTSPNTPVGTPVIPGYEIDSVLGYGGVGVVYKARHLTDGRIVALKVLSPSLRNRPGELARFRREAEAAVRLKHPHIVRVHDVGEVDDIPYVAMEFMDRGSLAESLAGRPLPGRIAAEVVELLSRAVDSAHEEGFIHRDLKPANVLLETPKKPVDLADPYHAAIQLLGVPRVADFGLAKRVGEEVGQTRTGAVIGTPSYMAPEQAQGNSKQVGRSVDVYALGAVLYECLTGKPPFRAPTVLETLDLVRSAEPAPPMALQPGIPVELQTICLKCLNKLPADRYSTPAALADDLRRYLDGQSILARPTPAWVRPMRWLTHHAVPALLVLITLASVTLAAALWKSRFRDPRMAADATSVLYFRNLIKRHGVPEGIGPLREEQVSRRPVSFKFHYRGKLVDKVEAVDRRGRPTSSHSIATHLEPADQWRFTLAGPQTGVTLPQGLALPSVFADLVVPGFPLRVCSWEYLRDGDGNVIKEIARDVRGRIVWTFQFTSPDTGQYLDDRGFLVSRAGSGAAYVKLIHGENGLEKEVHYLGRNGKPRPDVAGIFGRRFEHDELGLVKTVSFLGPRDHPVLHPLGYARIARRWDDRGLLLEEAYLDLRGQIARGNFGRGAAVRWTYDEDDNPLTQEHIGLDGKPTTTYRMQYDARGNLRSREVVSIQETTTRRLASRAEYDYDADDNCIRSRYLDAEGKPWVSPNSGSCGQAMICKDGRVVDLTFLGPDGNPAEAIRTNTTPDANAPPAGRSKEVRIRYDYNARGQIISESYFGLDGRPVADRKGAMGYRCRYDDAGQPHEVVLVGSDGQPIQGAEGYARRVWKYDEQGRLEEVSTYDGEGRLTAVKPVREGWPALVSLFQSPFSGRPMAFAAGRLTLTWDDRGNPENAALFGEDGRAMADAQGVARVESKHDEQGNLSQLATFDVDGEPVANQQGVARITFSHDGFGNLIEAATFDAAGKPVAAYNRIARHVRRFDDRYNLVEEAFWGADGKPTPGTFGYARVRFQYDDEDNLTASTYYDDGGRPVQTRVIWLNATDRQAPGVPRDDVRLEAGDVILAYDGQQVHCARLFSQRKRLEGQGGPPRQATVLRKGKKLTLSIPAGALRLDDFFGFRRTRGSRFFVGVPGRLELLPFVETRGEDMMEEDD